VTLAQVAPRSTTPNGLTKPFENAATVSHDAGSAAAFTVAILHLERAIRA
jgi:hypothetical protein